VEITHCEVHGAPQEIIEVHHLDKFYQEKRMQAQRIRHRKGEERYEDLWPVVEAAVQPKTSKKGTHKKTHQATSAEGSMGEGSRDQMKLQNASAAHAAVQEAASADQGQVEASQATSRHWQSDSEHNVSKVHEEAVCDQGEAVEGEANLTDSSSDDDEGNAGFTQDATPGVAYMMIRKLKYPHESSSMQHWQNTVAEIEKHKEQQVRAYENMCDFLHTTCVGLRALKGFINDKRADKLTIHGLNFGPNNATAFAGIMKGMDLSGNSSELQPMMRLRANLGYAALEHLDCSNNSLGGLGGDQLVDCLLESQVRLKTLNISCNNLGQVGGLALVELLSIKESPLLELLVDDNGFGDATSAAMLRVIPASKSIRRLSLNKNKIGQAGSNQLAAVLSSCASLQELNVGWNEIRGKAALDLAAGLQQNSTLLRLDLSWNGFGDASTMRGLADALAVHPKISWLKLVENKIGAPGCAVLADGLESNTSLEEVVLDSNSLTMQGVRHLLRATCSLADPPKFSMDKCSFARHTGVPFDPAEPGGYYLLDLHNAYSHRIVKELIRYQTIGNGVFDKARPCVVKASPHDGEERAAMSLTDPRSHFPN
jgi:Ran GTPase-activating protein (RanGAP) involved in mRNA processing and transport